MEVGPAVVARRFAHPAASSYRTLPSRRRGIPQSFRDAAQRRARNPCTSRYAAAMDSGLAPSARPGMTT